MAKIKNRDEFTKKWAKVVAKAWTDEAFKQKLLKNPEKTLKEMGLEFPKDMHVEIHEQTGKTIHFMLPQKPKGELSEIELKKFAARGKSCTSSHDDYCGASTGDPNTAWA